VKTILLRAAILLALPALQLHAEEPVRRAAEEKACVKALRALPVRSARDPELLTTLQTNEYTLGFHPAFGFSSVASIAVSVTPDQLIWWDLKTARKLRSISGFPMQRPTAAIPISADGKRMALACADKAVRVLKFDSGEVERTLPCDAVPQQLTFSADGSRLLAVLSSESPAGLKVAAWKTDGWERIIIDAGTKKQSTWTLSPHGKFLAHASTEAANPGAPPGTIDLWNLESGEQKTLSGKFRTVRLAFSVDISTLFVAITEKDRKEAGMGILAVDLKSEESRQAAFVTGDVTSIQATPDGKYLLAEVVAPFGRREVRLVELASGKERWSGKGEDALRVFSPGMQMLAQSSTYRITLQAMEDLLHEAWADLGPGIAKARREGFGVTLHGGKIMVSATQTSSGPRTDPLAQTVPGTTHLGFYGHEILPANLITPLKSLPNLVELKLLGSQALERNALASLRELKALRRLDLSGRSSTIEKKLNGPGDDDLAPLAQLESLESLSITASPRITEAGLRHLAGLKNLRSLNLFGVADDEGLEHLKGLENLRELNLHRTQVRGKGLVHLQELTRLETLNLSECALRPGRLEPLARLTSLTVLNLERTGVTDEDMAHLKGLTKLRELKLGHNPGVTVAGLAHLRDMKSLEILDLQGAGLDGDALEVVARFPRLKQLNVTSTNVSDEAFRHLAGLTELTELKLGDTPIRGPGLAHLKGCPKLTELSLTETRIDDRGLEGVKELRQLVKLHLSMRMTDAGLAHLAGLDRLEELFGPARIHGQGLPHLKGLSNLRRLMSLVWIDDEGAEGLRALTQLREISLGPAPMTARSLQHLKGLSNLRRVQLPAHPSITAEQVATLEKALPFCRITR
jgi:Leucine-rich repeat (LRR) protein